MLFLPPVVPLSVSDAEIPYPLTIITPFWRERMEYSLESAAPAQRTSHNPYASFPEAGIALPTMLSSTCWRQGSQSSRALAPAVRSWLVRSRAGWESTASFNKTCGPWSPNATDHSTLTGVPRFRRVWTASVMQHHRATCRHLPGAKNPCLSQEDECESHQQQQQQQRQAEGDAADGDRPSSMAQATGVDHRLSAAESWTSTR